MGMIKQDADLYVVGGGILGLCSALQLQSQGQSVVIFEAEEIGKGASFGNAGHLAVEQVFPIADPSIIRQLPSMLFDPLGPLRLDIKYLPKLFPWAAKLLLNMRPEPFAVIHEALKQINGISLHAWQDFARQWELNSWVQVKGSVLCTETAAGLEKLKSHGNQLNAIGVPNRLLGQSELLALEPGLAANQQGALLFPETGHITDLAAVIQTLTHHFVSLGGKVYEHCRVLDMRSVENGIVLNTVKGEIVAGRVLLTMGAFSKSWVKKITGVSVPLDTERGYHLMLPKVKDRLSVPVTSLERRFIMTPMKGGLRLAGTVEYAGLSAPPNMSRAYNLLKLARPMLKDAIDDEDSSVWMGFRPSTADSLPVIDKVGRVFLNFGHQHLGLTQAVSSARLIEDLYFDRASVIDRKPYRLSRFGTGG